MPTRNECKVYTLAALPFTFMRLSFMRRWRVEEIKGAPWGLQKRARSARPFPSHGHRSSITASHFAGLHFVS